MRTYLTADLYRHGPALAAQLHRQAAAWWAAQGRPVEALRHAAQARRRHPADRASCTGGRRSWWRGASTPNCAGARRWPWSRRAPRRTPGCPSCRRRSTSASGDRRRGAGRRPPGRRPWPGHRTTRPRPLPGRHDTAGRPGRAGPGSTRLAHRTIRRWPRSRSPAAAPPGIFAVGRRRPTDAAAVLADLEAALAVARDQHLGLLEVQCLCLIGTAALIAGDHARAAAAADRGDRGRGRARVAGLAVDGRRPRRAGARLPDAGRPRPGRCRSRSTDCGSHRPTRIPSSGSPCAAPAAGALFDLGRPAGRAARAAGGPRRAGRRPRPRAAGRGRPRCWSTGRRCSSDFPAAATDVDEPARRPGATPTAELDPHAGVVRGGRRLRATGPRDGGTAAGRRRCGRSCRPPSSRRGSWRSGARCGSGDRPAARQALQAALALAEPLDALRPFALAGQGLRVLLVDQLGGARDPAAFAFRCLAARQRVQPAADPQLSAREQDVLAQLVSLSNLGEIADDLDGVGQHDQEPRPGDLRQARGEHPPHRRPDGARTRAADMTGAVGHGARRADRPASASPRRTGPEPSAAASRPTGRSA